MNVKRIHFIGIGGIGMSGLARLFRHEGAIVSGSDAHKSAITEALTSEGIEVVYQQGAANVTDDIELAVFTEAMPKDHPELLAAHDKGIRTINYFEALAEVANEYYLIAVAGTHGKTTTTAMLIDIFEEASYDPTAIVGSLRSKTGSNYRAGKGKYFIVEACEYKRDFLSLRPDVLVITNLEHEHVDYYKDLADVQSAFHDLAQSVPEEGFVVCDLTDDNVTPAVNGARATVVDYRAFIDPLLKLHLPGIHNSLNAAAASAAADTQGIEKSMVKIALENFAGTWRRFEFKGEVNGAKVYDDYSHHPTEIQAAINGARELYPSKKLTVVFQPHTYSRTVSLFADFVKTLGKADEVILVPIYAAREENESEVTSEKIAESLNESRHDAKFFHTLPAVVQELKETLGPDDVVIVMGAGDVTSVASMLVE